MPDQIATALDEMRNRHESLSVPFGRLPRSIELSQADVPRLLAALDAVLALHTEFRIYDECDHNHTTEDIEQGIAVDCGDFASCHEVYMYSICRACCTEPEYGQTEQCAGGHDHRPSKAICPTAEAISRALLGEDGNG